MRTDKWKKRLIVFIICFSVVVPGMFSEIITTNSITSQDIDTQLGTFSIDDPVGGTTFVVNAPEHNAPANGLITFDRTVTISWGSVFAAINYGLQVDNNADFSSPVVDVTTGTSRTYTTGSLSNGIYYWRVRAQVLYVVVPIWEAWSTAWNFRVNYAAPALVFPSSGITTFDSTPYLDWNSVLGASTYYLQIDDSSSFSSINYQYSTSGTYYYPSLPNNVWYWRVYARDSQGNYGPYSGYRSFRVITTPPALVSPANGVVTMDNTPYLDWGSVVGATLYELQIDDNPSFSSPNTAQTALTYLTSPTLSNGVWYWRVRARDQINYWGSFSSYRYFTVDTSPPGVPVLLTPTNGAYTSDSSPYFSWNPVSTAVLYRIQVALDSGFTSGLWSTTTGSTSYSSVSFSDGLRYWRVQARDTVGNWGAYSSYRTFTIDTVAPAQPVLVSPDDDLLDNDPTVYLEWEPVSTAWQYNIQVSFVDDFSLLIVSAGSTFTHYTTQALSDDIYYWRIRAADLAGNWGSWSIVRSFTIDTTAPTISAVDNDPIIPTDTETITISCDVTDLNGVGQVSLYYRVNGGSWSSLAMAYDSGDTYEATIGTFSYADEIEYYITADDVVETANSATNDNSGAYYSFTIVSSDVTAPTFTYTSWVPFNPDDTEEITILCDVTDLNGIQSVTLYYRINGGAFTSLAMIHDFGDRYNVTIGPFAYGYLIEYYLTATDDSPNHNLATEDNLGSYFPCTILSSDDSGPVITDVQHEPLLPTDLQTVNITCTVTDPNGICNVTLFYRVDGGIWSAIDMTLLSGDTYNATIGPFNYDEEIQYYILAFDDYVLHNSAVEDNTGAYYSFTILHNDTIAPEITSISHSPTTPNELDMITISCDATDANGIFAVYLYYRVNGGSWVPQSMSHTSGNTYSRLITSFYYGDVIEYWVRAVDNSPNQNAITDDNGGSYYSFTIVSSDNTNPTINTVVYEPTTPTEYDSINITCYAFDANGLLDVSLHYRINDGAWTIVDMTVLAGNFYNVTLNPFNVEDLVEFYITATDDSVANNVATDDNGGLYYSITITQYTVPTPIAYLIPIITVFSLIVIIRKRK